MTYGSFPSLKDMTAVKPPTIDVFFGVGGYLAHIFRLGGFLSFKH